MSERKRIISVVLLLLLAAVSGFSLTIKLGSLAPIGSPWDVSLKKIAAEWARLSNGMVRVKIYSGGIAGDEPNMLRQMRIGQLQAAGLTVKGLNQIYDSVLAVALPLVVRTDDELDYVLNRMRPTLEAGLEKNGYKLIFWSTMGWVYFFSRSPIITPDDLRKQKLWVWEGDTNEETIWKRLNFHVVPLEATDLLTALKSGMVDAYASSPLTAAAYQWFALSPNMADMRWGPMFGGLVVSMRTWRRIPKNLQSKLIAAAEEVGASMKAETSTADKKAIDVMTKYGLKINHVPDDVVEQWAALMREGFTELLGRSVNPAAYEEVKSILAEYRK